MLVLELGHRDVVVRTLGSIDAYASLAIAGEGSRAVYVGLEDEAGEQRPGLFAVDIGDQGLGPARRVADVKLGARLLIGADGQVVVVEELVEIAEHGKRSMARAFVL